MGLWNASAETRSKYELMFFSSKNEKRSIEVSPSTRQWPKSKYEVRSIVFRSYFVLRSYFVFLSLRHSALEKEPTERRFVARLMSVTCLFFIFSVWVKPALNVPN